MKDPCAGAVKGASVFAAAALGVLAFGPATAQNSDVVSAFEAGQQRFERNCGICHGLDAKGGGAFTELLKVEPPDLTVLSKNNHGDFPFTAIYNAIDGRNTPLAHGLEGMPIWGDRFKQSVEDGKETLVRGRILELILYIQSLQEY